MEEINWRTGRFLDKSLDTTLTGGDWLRHEQSLSITARTAGERWLGDSRTAQ